jgi:Zn-dependent protease with chaperone function
MFNMPQAADPRAPGAFVALLVLLFGAAVLMSAWVSHRAKTADGPPADRWFRLYVWISLRTSGVWLALWIICAFFHGVDVLSAALSIDSHMGQFGVVACLVIAGAMVNIACASLEAPRYADVRHLAIRPADIIRIELLKEVCIASAALALAALDVAVDFSPTAGILLPLTALIPIFAAGWKIRSIVGMRPFAQSHGELREAVFRLAARGGVTVKNLYVLPSNDWKMVNAFAARGSNVMLSEALVQALTRREADALIAHELTHVRENHIRKIGLGASLVIVAVVIATVVLPFIWQPLNPFASVPAAAIVYILVTPAVRRRFEWRADAGAVALTQDSEALITGLVKVTRLNCIPLEFKKPWSWLVTHPSTLRRVQAIAKRFGVPDTRLHELITADPHNTGEPGYPIEPAETITGRLFTTEFKSKSAFVVLGASLAIFIVVPLLASAAAAAVETASGQVMIYAAAALIAVALDWFAAHSITAAQSRRLSERLFSRLLLGKQIPPGAPVFFVSLSPSRAVRLYEYRFEWDVGYLWFDQDMLFYKGELAEFALSPEAVSSIEVMPARFGLHAGLRLVLTIDAPEGKRVAAIRPAGLSTLRAARKRLAEIERLAREWHAGARTAVPGTAPHVAVPAEAEVTSESLRNVAKAAGRPPIIIAAVAMLVDVNLSHDYVALTLTIWAATLVSTWVRILPLRRYREPSSAVLT